MPDVAAATSEAFVCRVCGACAETPKGLGCGHPLALTARLVDTEVLKRSVPRGLTLAEAHGRLKQEEGKR
jgi:hypothetical protein